MAKPLRTEDAADERSDADALTEAGKKELEASLARERARLRAGLDDS